MYIPAKYDGHVAGVTESELVCRLAYACQRGITLQKMILMRIMIFMTLLTNMTKRNRFRVASLCRKQDQ